MMKKLLFSVLLFLLTLTLLCSCIEDNTSGIGGGTVDTPGEGSGEGTKAEWANVEKQNWISDVATYIIHCEDGDKNLYGS